MVTVSDIHGFLAKEINKVYFLLNLEFDKNKSQAKFGD